MTFIDPNPTHYTSEDEIPAHIHRFEWWYKDLVSPRVGFWIEKVLENQAESWRTIEYLRQALRQEKAKSAALQSELDNYYEQFKP